MILSEIRTPGLYEQRAVVSIGSILLTSHIGPKDPVLA